MSPVTHLLLGWTAAHAARLEKRDRLLVTLAGLAPDLDGLGVIPEYLTRHTSHPLYWWSDYHHVLGHNLAAALVCALLAFCLARRPAMTATLALASFHLHLLGDILGGRGPDGYVWTVPYLWPFTAAGTWAWEGQWKLNSWQNLVLTATLLAWTLRLAWINGWSPLEFVSRRADAALVETLRRRFPRAQS